MCVCVCVCVCFFNSSSDDFLFGRQILCLSNVEGSARRNEQSKNITSTSEMFWNVAASYFLDDLYQNGERAIDMEEKLRTRPKGGHRADGLLQHLEATTQILHVNLWNDIREDVPLKFLVRFNHVADLYDRHLQRGVKAVQLSVRKGRGDKCRRFVRAVRKHYGFKIKKSVKIFDTVDDFLRMQDHVGLENYLSLLESILAPRRSPRVANQRREQESIEGTHAVHVS